MINAILSFTLFLTPMRMDSIFEEIRITDRLTIKAEYVDTGILLEREGMLLSVEDFSIIQSEFLTLGQAWETRVKSLNETHTAQLLAYQAQCASEYRTIQSNLRLNEERVKLLSEGLADVRANAKLYKWVAISLGIISAGSIGYILTRR